MSDLRFDAARLAFNEARYADAVRLADGLLNENYDDVRALLLLSRCIAKTEKYGLAAALAKRAVDVAPNNQHCWNALGRTYMMSEARFDDATACFEKALAIQPDFFDPMANLICLNVNRGDPVEAIKWAERASWVHTSEQIVDEAEDVFYNRGLAEIMLAHWPDGWKHYCHSHRHRIKKEWAYGDEARWDGKPVENTLVVYGEQGLGDEIMFASALPDAMKLAGKVVVDCDARLRGLFRRSFPDADVYGTRNDTHPLWDREYKIDARAGGADVCKFTRTTFDDFPGRPYLVADPERRIQWRALLASLGRRPKIGIAWNGGRKGKSFRERRSVTLSQLLPILRQDATWVNLEYEDATKDIETFRTEHHVSIHNWPHALLTVDYDDTAALVAELDLVICVTTTVMNLAGALGKTCWCLVPKRPTWREGIEGDHLAWYGSTVRMFRQETHGVWEPVIERVAQRLAVYLAEKEEDRWAFAS